MRSAWIYPKASAIDEILQDVRLHCKYVHVVGSEQEWDIYPHTHEAVEFCCVLSGRGWYCTPDERHRAVAEDFFVSPPGEVHWETREPGSPFELAFLNMEVEGPRAPELFDFFSALAGKVEFGDAGLLRQAMDVVVSVSAEAVGQRPGFITLIEAQLLSLCICLWRSAVGEPAVSALPNGRVAEPAGGARVHAVREYIWQNLGHDLTLEAVAQAFFYHPKYLSALFSRETGVPLSEWIQIERIQKVKELLANTALSIDAIASQTGYSSLPHLYRRFRAEAGLTPSAYRKRMREREGQVASE